MKILGIDPGTGITGFGVIETDGVKHTLIDAGVIRTKPKTPQPTRLATIHGHIVELLSEHSPTVMSVEKLFFAQNVTTAMTVSQARGVVLLAAEQHGVAVAEYTPLQIKQAITGYGRAEKAQIQEMVRIILRLNERPKPDDCADALAAAICHVMSADIMSQQ
jgi:crossover junction endodeoxyribonuclease RuvC